MQVSQRRDDRWLRSHWFPSGPTGGSTTQGSAFTRGIENGEPYRLYLVTNPTVQASLNLKPFGIRVQPVDFCADHFEFRRADYPVSQLLTLFRLAHARSSNDQQRVMPRWMIVDLVLMPSAVLLAVAGQDHVISVARELENSHDKVIHGHGREYAAMLRDLLQMAYHRGYSGPLPVAGYAAIPTPVAGRWVGGSLWWSLIPGKRLGYSVRRIALECYGADHEVGVTQFDDLRALHVQKDFGKLRVTHTTLAAHPRDYTFVYEVDLRKLPRDGRPAPADQDADRSHETELGPDAAKLTKQLREMQQLIAQGVNHYVKPQADGNSNPWPVIYTDRDPRLPEIPANPGQHDEAGQDADRLPAAGLRIGHPYQAYIVSNASMFPNLNLAPFGVSLKQINFCEETFKASSGKDYPVPGLLNLLSRAITLSYSESGLGMPPWAMVELAIMSSAVVLIMADQNHLHEVARRLAQEPVTRDRRTRLVPLAEDDRDRLRNANSLRVLLESAKGMKYTGPLPIAGYAATATPRCGRWVGWSLWSLVPGEKLGYTVKRLALACYGVTAQTAVIQLHMSRGLDVLAKFGTPKLIRMDVPAHPAPHALVYELDVSELPPDGSPVPAAPARKATCQLDPDGADLGRDLANMQREIEQGTEYYLLPRSSGRVRSPMIPVCRRARLRRRLWFSGKTLIRQARARRAGRRRANLAP